MDKDTLRAIEIINEILEDLLLISPKGNNVFDSLNLLNWKDRITDRRTELTKIINDNKE